ncbi:hypothetical protein AB0H36_34210 [Kribbella sp. NPDC050820]|uniref:hypothetical protein n=1 Tax=Kribbella sp. NPDC050820 TaxID=3155408 RepID=UPI0033F84BFD
MSGAAGRAVAVSRRILPAAQAGFIFPAFNLAVIGGSLAGPYAAHRAGTRRNLLSGFTVMGVSLGLASVSSTTAGTSEVPEHQRGVARRTHLAGTASAASTNVES